MALIQDALINLDAVSLDFPIFNSNGRSIKNQLAQFATGGLIRSGQKSYTEVRALDGISLRLEEGDRLAILGPNGAGKTSLLRLLTGVYGPTFGNVEVIGKTHSLIDIGIGINAESTGRENLYLRGALMGHSKKEVRKYENQIIEFAELGEFIDLPVRTYSSGMQLRLAFAVSTAIKPEILIMDEWLSVGDEHFRLKAEQRIKSIVDSTKILVIATHSRTLALNTCNKAIWLDHGKIVMTGKVGAVCNAYFQSNAN